jgi:hypothetical protein
MVCENPHQISIGLAKGLKSKKAIENFSKIQNGSPGCHIGFSKKFQIGNYSPWRYEKAHQISTGSVKLFKIDSNFSNFTKIQDGSRTAILDLRKS